MLYTDIVGQQEAKARLIKMVNENRVPHALLFAGDEGCGHLPTAVAFAQHLFCRQRNNDGPCNTCPACLKVAKLAHPDLHLVFPIAQTEKIKICESYLAEFREAFLNNPYLSLNEWFGELNAENKQPVISVSEAAEIIKKLSLTSYEGTYKVMIIWQPEKMTAQASNSILKILEEPTENTIFILVSSQADQLLGTILSRVQRIPFINCTVEEITNGLISLLKIGNEKANQSAILSDGNFAEAKRIANDLDEEVSFLSHFQAFMRLAFSSDFNKAVTWVEENASLGREKHKQFFQYGLEVFRDCLMYNYGTRDLVRLSGQEKQFLEKFAPFITQTNYESLIEAFNSNYYYIERNANPKILFMDLFIQCSALISAQRRS